MIKIITEKLKGVKNDIFNNPRRLYRKKSYAQNGEDLIIDFIFNVKKHRLPTYIDIGAFHPFRFSNTAIFYERGCRGINIEPNPDGYKLFKKFRRSDVNLNIGISDVDAVLTYYRMNSSALNTFSRQSALDMVNLQGAKILEEVLIPVKSLQQIISQYAGGIFPDFLSLDVEGLDMLILEQIDFANNYPKVICVETVEYTTDATGEKNEEIIGFLKRNGYFVFADTNINTLFINSKYWST